MIFVKCAGHLTTSFSIIDLKEQLCIYLKTYTQTFRLHAMIIPLGFASKSSVYQSFQWYHILCTDCYNTSSTISTDQQELQQKYCHRMHLNKLSLN